MSLRDELAEALREHAYTTRRSETTGMDYRAWHTCRCGWESDDHDGNIPDGVRVVAYHHADAILPIIERETTRARAEVGSLIRAHQAAEAAYWAMADDADDETASRLAADVTRTYEALLASFEGES